MSIPPIISQSILISAPLNTLWGYFSEPNKWPLWDKSLRTVELLESPKVGAQGMVFPVSGKPIPFKILKISAQKEVQVSFSSEWLTRIYDYRLIEMAEGCVVTIAMHCVGPLGGIANRLLRSRYIKNIERHLDQLRQCVESRTSQAESTVDQKSGRGAWGAS